MSTSETPASEASYCSLALGRYLPRSDCHAKPLPSWRVIVFGVAFGTGISVIAALCGCMISFFVARFLARDLVTQKFPEKFKRMDAFLAENAFTTSLLIRILPIGSNLVTSLLAGVSRVSPLPFFAGSGIGYIPQMLIFALVGSGFAVEPNVRLVVSIVLFAVSGFMGLWLYRRYRDGHKLLNAGVISSERRGRE